MIGYNISVIRSYESKERQYNDEKKTDYYTNNGGKSLHENLQIYLNIIINSNGKLQADELWNVCFH